MRDYSADLAEAVRVMLGWQSEVEPQVTTARNPAKRLAAAISGIGTWAIGQVAIQYFELGKNMGSKGLQSLYRQKVKERRGTKAAGEIRADASG